MATNTTVNFNTSGFLSGTSGITWMQAYVVNGGSIVQQSGQNYADLTVASPSIQIQDGSFSGRIYILAGSGTAPNYSSEASILPGASSNQQRYVVYELNLGNSASDVLDITAINGLGFNVSAESVLTSTSYYSGSAIPFSGGSGSSLTSLITSAPIGNTQAVQSNASGYNQIFGPSGTPGTGYWPTSYWDSYYSNVKDTASVINGMQFGGIYGIPGSAGGGYQLYNYRAYAATKSVPSGAGGALEATNGIVLYPVPMNVAVPTGAGNGVASDWIFVPDASLKPNIFQPGLEPTTYPLWTSSSSDFSSATSSGISTTPPYNATAIIATALTASYDAGFYGSFGTNPNPNVTQKLDLNKSWNVNWNYAYQGYLMQGITPGNGTSLGNLAVGSIFNGGNANGLNSGYYDPYAAVVSKYTNVYSWPYTDYLSTWGGNKPVIPLYDGSRSNGMGGTGANVETLNFTVYADSTTQPSTNFIAPTVGYLAPSGGSFSAATYATNNQMQISITYGAWVPDSNTAVKLRVYAPGQANSDSQGFVNFQLNGLYSSGNFNNWSNFTITPGSASQAWTIASNGASSGSTGILNINNVPVVQNGTAWYQLVFGSGTHATTYNIYGVANASGQYTQMVSDQSVSVVSLQNIPDWTPPTNAPLTAPNSLASTGVLVSLAGTYPTYDPAVYGAPRFARFTDGVLDNDVVLGNANAGQLANWQLNGQGQLMAGSGTLSATLAAGWQVVATGSFSGGSRDLLLENATSSGQKQLATWTVNGISVTPNAMLGAALQAGWAIVGSGHFMGGGQSNQILLQSLDHATGRNQLAYWQIDNSGQVTASGNIGGPLLNGWTAIATGNVLDNGRTDILLQNGFSLAIWELNDQGQVSVHGNINQELTPGWEVVGVGNFFGATADQDLLLQSGNQLAMWQLNAFDVGQQGLLLGSNTLQPGWAVAGIGDYEGNGISDILLQNGNQFAQWQMNGLTVSNSVGVASQLSTGWNLVGTGNL